MRTVRLPTVHTIQATRCQHRWGSSSEQVWTSHCPWSLLTPPPPMDRQTDKTHQIENNTFPQLCWRTVISILFTAVKTIRNSNSFTSILHTSDIGLTFRKRGFNSFRLSGEFAHMPNDCVTAWLFHENHSYILRKRKKWPALFYAMTFNNKCNIWREYKCSSNHCFIFRLGIKERSHGSILRIAVVAMGFPDFYR